MDAASVIFQSQSARNFARSRPHDRHDYGHSYGVPGYKARGDGHAGRGAGGLLLNAGVSGGSRRPRQRFVSHPRCRRVRLYLAALLFAFTWLLSHNLLRGPLRAYGSAEEPLAITGIWSWAIPFPAAPLHSCLRASAPDKIARAFSYHLSHLRSLTFSTNAPDHDSTAVSLPSTAANPSDTVDAVDLIDPSAPGAGAGEIMKQSATPVPSFVPQMEKNSILRRIPDPQTSAPLRDFALNTEYISELTSHTHSNLGLRQTFGLKVFSSIAGFEVGRTLGQSPNMAFRDGGNNEQSCWIFPGSRGHLGIRLKERISVNKFTVDHLPRDMLSGFAILQAPRKIILWGRVDGPDNLSKARMYQENMGDALSDLYLESSFFGPISKSFNKDLFIPMANFEYKLSGQPQSNVQTKEVFRTLQSLQMDFEVVVLEIVSNWGAISTCLYRVRVHGDPLKAVALRTFA